MDYKKAYKEALERAKKVHKYSSDIAEIKRMEDIFPELAESDDKKIREAQLDYWRSVGGKEWHGVPVQETIAWLEKQGEQPSVIRWYDVSLIPQEAEELLVEWDSEDATWHEIAFYHADTKTFWDGERQVENVTRWCYIVDLLEKQGEQKPVDKVESKFKVGDWVVCEVTGSVYQIKNCIENLSNHKYGYDLTNGGYIGSYEVNHYHLWTIADAKDGDVLVYNNGTVEIILLFKKWMDGVGKGAYSYAHTFDNKILFNDWSDCGYATHPATKEQHELLFQKMREEGYVWDAEKKEVRKIEDEIPQEKSEVKVAIADLETPQDPILIRLDRIYDLLLEIRNNNMLRQPYIETYPPYPYPIQPWYDISKPYCNTTNKIDDERPEESL